MRGFKKDNEGLYEMVSLHRKSALIDANNGCGGYRGPVGWESMKEYIEV